jgi:ribose/xylose/arabinose/galactoside ABC-type transport system permease subunit
VGLPERLGGRLASQLTGRWLRGSRREPGVSRPVPVSGAGHPLVELATRMMVAQTLCSAAVGLFYSRRHLTSIIITLSLVVVLAGLVLLIRTGTHTAWLTAVGLESIYLIFGLYRFATSRYLGGTLLAIITLGVLAAPSVARAFGRSAGTDQSFGESDLADPARP